MQKYGYLAEKNVPDAFVRAASGRRDETPKYPFKQSELTELAAAFFLVYCSAICFCKNTHQEQVFLFFF